MFDPRRYTIDLLGAFALYAGLLILSRSIVDGTGEPDAVSIAIALLPMIGAVAIVLTILRHLWRMDELQRRIQLEAFCVAGLAVAMGTFTVGFLENAGFGRPSMVWVLPAIFGAHGLALPFMVRRYS